VRLVADWDDVARIAPALPGTTEAASASGRRRWLVQGKTFLRERPLHRTEFDELGADAPGGRVMVASVPDEGRGPRCSPPSRTSHSPRRTSTAGPAVLCRLDRLDETSLTELAGEAWAACAPRRLVAEHPLRMGT
jgi:hypothetical protein